MWLYVLCHQLEIGQLTTGVGAGDIFELRRSIRVLWLPFRFAWFFIAIAMRFSYISISFSLSTSCQPNRTISLDVT